MTDDILRNDAVIKKNRFQFDYSRLFWYVLIAVLLFLIVLPIGKLLIISFEDPQSAGFTLRNYVDAYGNSRHLEAIFNSVFLGVNASVLAILFALPLAWAISRTNIPGKLFIWSLVLGAFIIPPYLGAIGWVLLAGPNSGWINLIWSRIMGTDSVLFNIYSYEGLSLVMALNSFPYIFIFVKSALDLLSSEMEEASNILGAGFFKTTVKITLPLVLPSILAGVLIVFLDTIALFGTPAIIGIPARINVVTTQLWQFFEYPIYLEMAAAYAIPLLLITAGLIYIQKLILSRKGYVSQSGKGGERRTIDLRIWKWPVFMYCVSVGMLAVILPVAVLIQASFSKAWGLGLSVSNFTLNNYKYILFENTLAVRSIWNTLIYSAATATIAVLIATLIAYMTLRKLVRYSSVLSFIAMAPFVIPGVVMAVGFYAAYAAPPFALYGSALIIVFAFTSRCLPIAYANASAAVGSVNSELEEASRILGGTQFFTIRKITIPLITKSLVAGWLIIFIVSTRELSTAIFLVGPATRTMSVLLFDLSETGNFEVIAAFGGLMLLITFVLVGIGMKVGGRDFMLRRK